VLAASVPEKAAKEAFGSNDTWLYILYFLPNSVSNAGPCSGQWGPVKNPVIQAHVHNILG
jgi:hypothetical protein